MSQNLELYSLVFGMNDGQYSVVFEWQLVIYIWPNDVLIVFCKAVCVILLCIFDGSLFTYYYNMC